MTRTIRVSLSGFNEADSLPGFLPEVGSFVAPPERLAIWPLNG